MPPASDSPQRNRDDLDAADARSKAAGVSPLAAAGLVVALLLGGIWLLDRQLVARHEVDAESRLRASHVIVNESLKDWQSSLVSAAHRATESPRLRSAARSLARSASRNEPSVFQSLPQHNQLAVEMEPVLSSLQAFGYEMLSVNGFRVAASDPALLGRPSPMVVQPFYSRLQLGEGSVSQPRRADHAIRDVSGRWVDGSRVMYIGLPLLSTQDRPFAYLLIGLDAIKHFDEHFESGLVGQTGETFVVDQYGRLLNDSRFDDVYVDLELIPEASESAALELVVRPPQSPEKLTKAVDSVVGGASGFDISGYVNARGQQAVGVWAWIPSLYMGLVTEAEHEEMTRGLRLSRGILYWLGFGAVALVLGLAGLFEYSRRSSARHASELRGAAFFDSLTGLPNRRAFRADLESRLELAQRTKRGMALLFIDLDDFKRINDSLGHDVGDGLLIEVAVRLRDCTRGSDVLGRTSHAARPSVRQQVARLGGDEFTVLLSDIGSPEDGARVADRIVQALNGTLQIMGHDILVSPSVGIAIGPEDGADSDTLIKNADVAMYEAKRAGKNRYVFFSAAMGTHASKRLEIESALRSALLERRLEVHYQPLVHSSDGGLKSVEALVRWTHPVLGFLSPADFIPIAEKSGLIEPLGEWVLTRACEDCVLWQAGAGRGVGVAVNVASQQFSSANFVDTVRQKITETGIDASMLTLEVTERVVMEQENTVVQRLNALAALGCRIALDDFGTGYSSLSYLTRFHLDVLKIDQAFVRSLPDDQQGVAIATMIIAMGQSLGMEVVAEGVETPAQRDFLAEQGVHALQGWLFAKAMRRPDLETWAAQRLRLSQVG